jgi:hypothetical protein
MPHAGFLALQPPPARHVGFWPSLKVRTTIHIGRATPAPWGWAPRVTCDSAAPPCPKRPSCASAGSSSCPCCFRCLACIGHCGVALRGRTCRGRLPGSALPPAGRRTANWAMSQQAALVQRAVAVLVTQCKLQAVAVLLQRACGVGVQHCAVCSALCTCTVDVPSPMSHVTGRLSHVVTRSMSHVTGHPPATCPHKLLPSDQA